MIEFIVSYLLDSPIILRPPLIKLPLLKMLKASDAPGLYCGSTKSTLSLTGILNMLTHFSTLLVDFISICYISRLGLKGDYANIVRATSPLENALLSWTTLKDEFVGSLAKSRYKSRPCSHCREDECRIDNAARHTRSMPQHVE